MRYASSRLGRLTGVLALVVHLTVVGVVPFAVRRHAPVAVEDVVHVEVEGGADCSFDDGHLECQVCRILCRPVHAVAKAPLAFPAVALRGLESPVPADPVDASDGRATPKSRAPPRLV